MMKIKLPNGLYLTAEHNPDPEYPYEIFVGITDKNDRWLQDLAIIGNDYHVANETDTVFEDHMRVCVFADAEDEDYTHRFEVDFWKGAE